MKKLNEAALFLILLLCYGYTFPRWADPNQNSRLDMVVAVVEDGTFQIDKYVTNTVDYAKIDGHYYSDKAPGAAFLAMPFYAGLRVVLNLPAVDRLTERLANSESFKSTLRESGSGVLKQKVRFALAQVVLTFFVSALPTAILGVLLWRYLRRTGVNHAASTAIALGYGLLTPAFAYANAFYGHQLAAALLFMAFYLVSVPHTSPTTRLSARVGAATSAWREVGSLVLVGFCLGYSVITEFPAALIAGILFLYTAFKLHQQNQLQRIIWVILPLTLCAAVLMIYNNAIFGGPFKLGYSNSELWQDQHHTGFLSLTLPSVQAMLGITVGVFRGLFVLSPLLLLALPGLVTWYRSGLRRAEWVVIVSASLSMFLFNASSSMWWGGYAIGPRYILPALPFFVLGLAYAFAQPNQSMKWLKPIAIALFAGSLVATWGLTLAEQAFPPDYLYNPLVQHALPNWQKGNIARNIGTILGLRGPLSLLPLLALVGLLGALVWWTNKRQAQNG